MGPPPGEGADGGAAHPGGGSGDDNHLGLLRRTSSRQCSVGSYNRMMLSFHRQLPTIARRKVGATVATFVSPSRKTRQSNNVRIRRCRATAGCGEEASRCDILVAQGSLVRQRLIHNCDSALGITITKLPRSVSNGAVTLRLYRFRDLPALSLLFTPEVLGKAYGGEHRPFHSFFSF